MTTEPEQDREQAERAALELWSVLPVAARKWINALADEIDLLRRKLETASAGRVVAPHVEPDGDAPERCTECTTYREVEPNIWVCKRAEANMCPAMLERERKMCRCGHTRESHLPGHCWGCTGPSCDGGINLSSDTQPKTALRGAVRRAANELQHELSRYTVGAENALRVVSLLHEDCYRISRDLLAALEADHV